MEDEPSTSASSTKPQVQVTQLQLTVSQSQAPPLPLPVFEFTKRKRWADTLIGELVNVAILVFSLTGTVIHCDAAVGDVLGYSEDQIVGKNFSDLLHDGDTVTFFNVFNECVSSQTELTTYVRTKASDRRDPSTRLVEIKITPYQQPPPGTTANTPINTHPTPGPVPPVPQSVPGTHTGEIQCVFAMLNPYPTSSTNDLDDFLALRLENELLSQRLEALRSGNFSDDTLGSDTDESDELEDDGSNQENIVDISERALAQVSAALDAAASAATGAAGATGGSASGSSAFNTGAGTGAGVGVGGIGGSGSGAAGAQAVISPTTGYSAHAFAAGGEQSIDGQPIKKKRRLLSVTEGRICTACGRNNSPEWRKGPQGAKTLCNACGLRWAKKVKGTSKEGEGGE